jgi:hypothetical protein
MHYSTLAHDNSTLFVVKSISHYFTGTGLTYGNKMYYNMILLRFYMDWVRCFYDPAVGLRESISIVGSLLASCPCWWSLITTSTTDISVNKVGINIIIRIIYIELTNSMSLGDLRCFAGLCSKHTRYNTRWSIYARMVHIVIVLSVLCSPPYLSSFIGVVVDCSEPPSHPCLGPFLRSPNWMKDNVNSHCCCLQVL